MLVPSMAPYHYEKSQTLPKISVNNPPVICWKGKVSTQERERESCMELLVGVMRTPRELHPFTILLPRISWCHGPSNLPTPQRLSLDRRFHATGLQPDARLSQMVQQACSELLIPMVFHQRFWNIFDKVPKMDLWAVSLWISKTKCLDRKLVVEVPCISIQVAT